MGLKAKFEERIKRKELEIAEYETKIREARSYLQALQDSMKLLPKESQNTPLGSVTLRAGSYTYKVYEYLKKIGKPAHINDILKMIGKDVTNTEKVNLASTLGTYVRKKEIFTRTAPNTFGLIELETIADEPPDDFGMDSKQKDDVPY